jgi:O-antigen/teichoic acid export membrane protein
VNLGANALLVPHFLAVGAAASRVIAMLVMVLTTYVLAQRLWPQHVDFVALAKVGGWAVTLFAVAWSLPELPLLVSVTVKGLLVIALVALAIWSGAVEREDVAKAWAVVRGRLGALAPTLRNVRERKRWA